MPINMAVRLTVHAVLEKVDFDDLANVEKIVAYQAKQFNIEALTSRVLSLVNGFFQSDSFALARQNRSWRELYVSMPTEHSVLEGYIDLCIETTDGYVVVDYKTDTLNDDIDDKVQRYTYQAASYALALEHITQKPVVECRLVFLTERGPVERLVPDLEKAKTAITDL